MSVDLILRPSDLVDGKPWAVQLRYRTPVETIYVSNVGLFLRGDAQNVVRGEGSYMQSAPIALLGAFLSAKIIAEARDAA